MPDRRSLLHWTLSVLLGIASLVLLLCWGLYAAGARHLPDALPAASWHADTGLRHQFLAAEDIDPGATPRLNPVTAWLHADAAPDNIADAPPAQRASGLLLPSLAARVVAMRWPPPSSNLQSQLTQVALTVRLSREWTTDAMVDTILAESLYARDVRGIEAASQFYFQLPAKDLRPQETLAMVAVLRSPSWFDPVCNRNRFDRRYAEVARRIGGTGPAWTSAIALARLRAHDCARK